MHDLRRQKDEKTETYVSENYSNIPSTPRSKNTAYLQTIFVKVTFFMDNPLEKSLFSADFGVMKSLQSYEE